MSRGPIEQPDPEVVPLAHRRQFTAAEKLRILEEAGGDGVAADAVGERTG